MPRVPKEIFVVMPFGKRVLVEKGVEEQIDFDSIYNDLIRPAGHRIGWQVTRIDEVVRPGPISDQYLRRLFEAPVVIADVSMPNSNVFYELGIRHSISTGLTLLTALEGTSLPFDIAHLRVIFYDYQKLEESQEKIIEFLSEPIQQRTDNPVRSFLEQFGSTLTPSVDSTIFVQELAARIQRAKTIEQLLGVWFWAKNLSPLPALELIPLAEQLGEFRAWESSVEVLRAAAAERPNDFEIHRKLGWHLRHLGPDSEKEALNEFEVALQLNSNDPETLGMKAGLLKRQRDFTKAAEVYELASKTAPSSLYILVNQAATAILACPELPDAGLKLYGDILKMVESDESLVADPWSEVVAGEAAYALSEDDKALEHFRRAHSLTRSATELRSAADQIELLSSVGFRVDSGMRFVSTLRAMANREGAHISSPSTKKIGESKPIETPVIVHLSDIHFGTKPTSEGSSDMHRFYSGDYEHTLSEHLRSEFSSDRAHFDQAHDRLLLVISGDLTYQGTDTEFDRVRGFLDETCRALDLDKERVVVVPGNHDVHWPSAGIDPNRRFDNYLGFLERFYGAVVFKKLYPFVTWDFHVNSPRPLPSDIISVHNTSGVTIIGLNSCVYETSQDHYGFIGGRQLDNVGSMLDGIGGSLTDFRIAVMHHHLHPFPEPIRKKQDDAIWTDLSIIRDAGLVERRLEKLGFDLVLHGHKHRAQVRETLVYDHSLTRGEIPRLLVFGAGSTGVKSSELEHSIPNQYQLIETMRLPRAPNTAFLSLEWRELELFPGAEWTTRRRWIVNG